MQIDFEQQAVVVNRFAALIGFGCFEGDRKTADRALRPIGWNYDCCHGCTFGEDTQSLQHSPPLQEYLGSVAVSR